MRSSANHSVKRILCLLEGLRSFACLTRAYAWAKICRRSALVFAAMRRRGVIRRDWHTRSSSFSVGVFAAMPKRYKTTKLQSALEAGEGPSKFAEGKSILQATPSHSFLLTKLIPPMRSSFLESCRMRAARRRKGGRGRPPHTLSIHPFTYTSPQACCPTSLTKS